ncbi:MAG: MucR family transcriptional regulator [Alphaproteobacteria bacterium]|nr:MucR family transcriptional regulator [Alphaproteobacteria bacterium]
MEQSEQQLLRYAVDVVTAHVGNNPVSVSDVPGFMREVYTALQELSGQKAPEAPRAEPAVPIKSSIKRDYIVCLEDGKKLRMLKRYLKTQYGMTPEQYRTKWGLPADYPMNAPALAEQRSTAARTIGLGRKAKSARGK